MKRPNAPSRESPWRLAWRNWGAAAGFTVVCAGMAAAGLLVGSWGTVATAAGLWLALQVAPVTYLTSVGEVVRRRARLRTELAACQPIDVYIDLRNGQRIPCALELIETDDGYHIPDHRPTTRWRAVPAEQVTAGPGLIPRVVALHAAVWPGGHTIEFEVDAAVRGSIAAAQAYVLRDVADWIWARALTGAITLDEIVAHMRKRAYLLQPYAGCADGQAEGGDHDRR